MRQSHQREESRELQTPDLGHGATATKTRQQPDRPEPERLQRLPSDRRREVLGQPAPLPLRVLRRGRARLTGDQVRDRRAVAQAPDVGTPP